jgi:hypothetical protein
MESCRSVSRKVFIGTGIKYERYGVLKRNRTVQVMYLQYYNMGLREGFSETVSFFNPPVVTDFERVHTSRECAAYNYTS